MPDLIKTDFVIDHAPFHEETRISPQANTILDRLRATPITDQIASFTHYIGETTLSFLQRAKKIEINGEKYLVASIDLTLESDTELKVVSVTVHLAPIA